MQHINKYYLGPRARALLVWAECSRESCLLLAAWAACPCWPHCRTGAAALRVPRELVLQRRRLARAKARRRRRRARRGRCSGIGVLAEGAVVACPRETKRGLAWGEQAGGGEQAAGGWGWGAEVCSAWWRGGRRLEEKLTCGLHMSVS